MEARRIKELPEEQQKAAIRNRAYLAELKRVYAKMAGGFQQTYELVRCYEESFLSL